jgi:hypothetical protein
MAFSTAAFRSPQFQNSRVEAVRSSTRSVEILKWKGLRAEKIKFLTKKDNPAFGARSK